ncbi:MAG: MFS transporter [Pseudomonadota bacterium]
MLALVFVSVVINYMDRTNISVAASAVSEDLSLTSVQMGVVFSAFGWTYALFQIPGGLTVDIVKTRLLYPLILIGWSLATLVQAFVSGIAGLVGCRMAVGVFEAPSFPCNNRIATVWFPPEERATAIGIYTSGQFIGLALLMPALNYLQAVFGWRGLFLVSGGIGLVWAAVWYLTYRDPDDQESVGQDEGRLVSVSSDGAAQHDKAISARDFATVFSNRKLWGIYLGKFCLGGTLIFFLTWFPTYLVEYRGLGYVRSGFLASVPFLAAFCGVLVSGLISDYLLRRGWSNEFARKTPVVLGMFLTTAIVGANYTDSTFWVITCLSVAFFGNGLSSIAWVFVSFLAPPRLLGVVGGAFNFVSSLSAVLVPLVIGFLVVDGDFAPALAFIGALALLGACSFLFLVGTLERIDVAEKAT